MKPVPAVPDTSHRICYLTGDESTPNPLDLMLQSQLAKLTGGISPASLILAWMDWGLHMGISPGKQIDLLLLLQEQVNSWTQQLLSTEPGQIHTDKRFDDPGWQQWPYNLMSLGFLHTQQFWQAATSNVRGVSAHHENVVNFVARQLLDVAAPANFPWLNPEVISTTAKTGGKNLLSGLAHWMQDQGLELAPQAASKSAHSTQELAYQPGRDVALSQGQVVLRNELIELIQYAPHGSKVYAEPILIMPSWIMKYYILDLSPHNSLVKFLVEQGHTVFMISWKNPGENERDLGMEDYLQRGLFASLEEIGKICPQQAVHAVGYCLGGTLLSIGAAALAKTANQYPPLKSVTLLAAQTDFSEPGELGLFIDESQLAMLDSLMWEKGYLAGEQMSASFQLLNSLDLIWSRSVHEYQLGMRNSPNDLMSWNADTTRLPYRMHSEYLKHLFLHNDLAEGRYRANGHAVALNDISAPMFIVGTAKDHVSPWRSVYKIHLLCEAPIEFVLASGGHNAGIVSEPGHAHRSYQYLPAAARNGGYSSPEDWLAQAASENGSWWTHWQNWLASQSNPQKVKARQPAENPELGAAPGRYVFEI